MTSKYTKQKVYFWLMRIVAAIPLIFLGWIVGTIIFYGIPALKPSIFGAPTPGSYESYGIGPAILGSIYVMVFTMIFSFPIGVLAAIYLVEYAKDNAFTRMIRMAINTLASLPSIIYGVFGFVFFLIVLRFPKSAVAAALTLSLLTLPVIISATQEALLSIPKSYREAALAVGATKWQTIRDHVLPNAISGIMTGGILGLSRAGGETAPILFVYAVGLSGFVFSPLAPSMALPFTIYNLALQSTGLEYTLPLAFAACLILLIIITSLNILAIYIRNKARSKMEVMRVS
ncbi:MAG: phosphate ABC transporter permease PstA [Candidatus Odinarchaeum yellowstonii]|uniref:Phosphate transport system permease protein PstA n=1 Tax=Odinarchaeota yellowstonii (strain LCB_4) TaxID=1841599 RepID=A0AAF0D285_ODILC|nr:MAG: phosphate ABC transporter permease PstA [Candidatus Odinarchaeum yellowstonii]